MGWQFAPLRSFRGRQNVGRQLVMTSDHVTERDVYSMSNGGVNKRSLKAARTKFWRRSMCIEIVEIESREMFTTVAIQEATAVCFVYTNKSSRLYGGLSFLSFHSLGNCRAAVFFFSLQPTYNQLLSANQPNNTTSTEQG